MKINFHTLANSHVQHLETYQPGKVTEALERELGITSAIKLASNENPLGPSPHALSAAHDALLHAHLYPDGSCYDLKQALANFFQLDIEQFVIGNGSENILELIIKAYLHRDDDAVISQYAFLTIPLLIKSIGARAVVVPTLAWQTNIDAMIKAITTHTRVVFLVNPNNPIGTYTNDTDFRRLMSSIPPHILVVVDEAYADYIDREDFPTTVNYLNEFPNLIITRTFSKVYGLAALRIGYSMSSPVIADMLNRIRLPFNVNTVACKAAVAALHDQHHVQASIIANKIGMLQLEEGLTKLGYEYIPSICNFITIDVQDAFQTYQALLQEGVIVRPLNAYDLSNYIRVSIGTSEQNQRFLTALSYLTSGNPSGIR